MEYNLCTCAFLIYFLFILLKFNKNESFVLNWFKDFFLSISINLNKAHIFFWFCISFCLWGIFGSKVFSLIDVMKVKINQSG